MDKVQELFFRVRGGGLVGGLYDNPQPAISDQAAVIMVDRGGALVGVWDEANCGFSHPSNQFDLERDAKSAVQESYPDMDFTKHSERIFTCPLSIANRFVWL